MCQSKVQSVAKSITLMLMKVMVPRKHFWYKALFGFVINCVAIQMALASSGIHGNLSPQSSSFPENGSFVYYYTANQADDIEDAVKDKPDLDDAALNASYVLMKDPVFASTNGIRKLEFQADDTDDPDEHFFDFSTSYFCNKDGDIVEKKPTSGKYAIITYDVLANLTGNFTDNKLIKTKAGITRYKSFDADGNVQDNWGTNDLYSGGHAADIFSTYAASCMPHHTSTQFFSMRSYKDPAVNKKPLILGGWGSAADLRIALRDQDDAPKPSYADKNGPGGGGAAQEGSDDCADNAHGFGWVFCPLIDTAEDLFAETYQKFIKSTLKITTPGRGDPIHEVWENMRDLANVAFVLIFLYIIFHTVLGHNLESYTIKKILPKLVAAAILVQFSYVICQVMLDIGNVFGEGIAELFKAAGSTPSADHASSLTQGFVLTGGLVLAGALGALLVSAVGIVAIIGLAITAIFGFLSIFVTLLIRKFLIYVLIMVAPLAFAAMVLPNTEKIFKIWMNNMMRMVMMFPLISALFAISNLLTPGFKGTGVNALIASSFPILACFLVPVTFKWAGGIFNFAEGYVGGAIRGAGRGSRNKFEGSNLAGNLNAARDIKKARALDEKLQGKRGILGFNGARAQNARQRWAHATQFGFGRKEIDPETGGLRYANRDKEVARLKQRQQMDARRREDDPNAVRNATTEQLKDTEGLLNRSNQRARHDRALKDLDAKHDEFKVRTEERDAGRAADISRKRSNVRRASQVQNRTLDRLDNDTIQAFDHKENMKELDNANNVALQQALSAKKMQQLRADGNVKMAENAAEISKIETDDLLDPTKMRENHDNAMRKALIAAKPSTHKRHHKEESAKLDALDDDTLQDAKHEEEMEGIRKDSDVTRAQHRAEEAREQNDTDLDATNQQQAHDETMGRIAGERKRSIRDGKHAAAMARIANDSDEDLQAELRSTEMDSIEKDGDLTRARNAATESREQTKGELSPRQQQRQHEQRMGQIANDNNDALQDAKHSVAMDNLAEQGNVQEAQFAQAESATKRSLQTRDLRQARHDMRMTDVERGNDTAATMRKRDEDAVQFDIDSQTPVNEAQHEATMRRLSSVRADQGRRIKAIENRELEERRAEYKDVSTEDLGKMVEDKNNPPTLEQVQAMAGVAVARGAGDQPQFVRALHNAAVQEVRKQSGNLTGDLTPDQLVQVQDVVGRTRDISYGKVLGANPLAAKFNATKGDSYNSNGGIQMGEALAVSLATTGGKKLSEMTGQG